jgi:hypothetical protein
VKYIAHCALLVRAVCRSGSRHGVPLWNPYMLSCRTNEDIFVCLKYCLAKSAFTRKCKAHRHLRKDF